MFRGVATVLAAVLVIGAPPVMVGAAEPNAAAAPAALSVASEPAGANVFVDGQYQGTTPVELARLANGDHRVRLVKDGYLENSRLVSVASGKPGRVQVQLTPRPALQVEPGTEQGGGGGSSKKWLFIGLGVAAVGAGVFLLLPKDKAPNAGTITVTPSGTGMAGVTNFSFTSTANDPDNDPITYAWNFGDGGTGSGVTATHVFGAPGTYAVKVTVTANSKTAEATTSVTVGRNLSASWAGRVFQVGNPATLRTTQSGGSLSGTLTLSQPSDTSADVWCNGTCAGSITGTVNPTAYPAQVTFQGNISGLAISFSGQSTDGGSLTGTTTWNIFGVSRSGPATFTRQ